MAISPSNTHSSYDMNTNREDLSDVIYNVDPTDTPFTTSIGRTDAIAVLHEWPIDVLAAASGSNAVLEGADATTDAQTSPVRLSNTCQISDKVPRVTGTQQAVRTAGINNTLEYFVTKAVLELRTDIETSLCANNAEVTGDVTTARQCAGLEAWYHTNGSGGTSYSAGSSGAATDGNTAATDGTQRDLTEAMLKTVVLNTWNSGGAPDMLMCGGFIRQKISTFTGNSTRMVGAEDRKLYASIDIYESDFGDLEIMPNRFQRARSLHVMDRDLWAVAWLRPPGMADLAKTGDSERRQVIAEYTLEARNALGSGIVADLNTS